MGSGNQSGTTAFPTQRLNPGEYVFEWRHGPPNTSMLSWGQPKLQTQSAAFEVTTFESILHTGLRSQGASPVAPPAGAVPPKVKRKLEEMEEENAYLRQELQVVAQQLQATNKGLPDPSFVDEGPAPSSGPAKKRKIGGRGGGGGAGAGGGGGGTAVKVGTRVRIFGLAEADSDVFNGQTGTVAAIKANGDTKVKLHQEGGRLEDFQLENLTPLATLPTPATTPATTGRREHVRLAPARA